MDARLYDDVLQFIECIKDTPEYREYREKKREIAEDPALLDRMEDLRSKNYKMYSGFTGNEDALEEIMKFADENEDTFMEPVIHDYLTAESAFCRMMREILNMTMKEIDF